MARQTFQCPSQCGLSDSAHRIFGGCRKVDEATKVDQKARESSSILLCAAALAEENDRLKVRLGKAMQLTIKALTEESRSKSLSYSRMALAAMRGIGEG